MGNKLAGWKMDIYTIIGYILSLQFLYLLLYLLFVFTFLFVFMEKENRKGFRRIICRAKCSFMINKITSGLGFLRHHCHLYAEKIEGPHTGVFKI